MKNTSFVAVVLTSLASLWLGGCAADASSPTGNEEQSARVPTTTGATDNTADDSTSEPSAKPSGGRAGATLSKSEGFAGLRADLKNDPKGALPGNSFDDNTCADGEVICSCGVCAPIASCITLCEKQIPQ